MLMVIIVHTIQVLKYRNTAQLMIFQSSTNRAGEPLIYTSAGTHAPVQIVFLFVQFVGLVDVESGEVCRGVELLPLSYQIYSGWYERVAVRRLTDVTDDQRKEMYQKLLKFREEMQGRPYEKSDLELVRSALNFSESYLNFLSNDTEDLSSLFCSEMVAEAYKRIGLLKTERLSNNFTPDDFSSARDSELKLEFGKLEEEVYIELKFDSA